MGEVGTNSPDSPSNIKMNGVNGTYEDEQMEIDDSQNDSQESSEISTKQSESSDISADVRDDGSRLKPTLEPIRECNTQEEEEEEEECDDDESGDKSEFQIKTDVDDDKSNSNVAQANGDGVPKKSKMDISREDDGSTMDSELPSVENDNASDDVAPIEGRVVDENIDDIMEHEDDEDDDDEDDVTVNEKNPLEESDAVEKENQVTNGDGGGSIDEDVEHVPIVEEVHAISDSDDDEEQNQRQRKDSISPMEVDGKSNGHNSRADDDKPVSIHSDSDDDQQDKGAKNGNGRTEQSSDNEDCVVIEDDNNKKDDDSGPRRSSRARKSILNVRDFASFDDVEEMNQDPLSQNVAKKPKITAPPSLGITIQDARSLAPDPLSGTSFQQQFIQAQGNSNAKKEPTLVIIDTNQIMARGGVQQAAATAAAVQSLQSQNFSVHPVGVPAQGVYPTNSRASITPIVQKSPPKPTTTPLLLPALTDDMFVLEAPSFIVPYIYEKPPSDNLKEIIDKVGKELAEQRKREEEEAAAEEKEAKDKEDKATKDETAVEGVASTANDTSSATTTSEDKKKKKKRVKKSGDESWDESESESTDDDLSDDETQRTKVLIKAVDEDLESIKTHIITPDAVKEVTPSGGAAAGVKRDNYFESPLGKFFMDIGINLVQEHVQTDLLRQQKKKLTRSGEAAPPSVQMAINSLKKNLELSKVKNEMFKFETKRCEYCSFKSESALSMAHHYETPHMNQHMYRCNFCSFETRPPYDILFHMEAVHNIKARLEKAISYHQCPNCPFEDNGRSKLARHSQVCVKKFVPEENLKPQQDWEPPAKIPRIKPRHGLVGTATAYQAMAAQAQRAASGAAMQRQNAAVNAALMRGRGRPQTVTKPTPAGNVVRTNQQPLRPQIPGMVLPNNFQLGAAAQYIQPPGPKSSKQQQPSISITPLPRQPASALSSFQLQAAAAQLAKPSAATTSIKPGQSSSGGAGGKASFVICEICDGYIKDLDQLRNHMQWMHKVKIHPKMIYNRPPLNCQKCQFRFFTDQGLERHLLGSHGLVTSSMQEAANKGKDAGRCPVCGRMYQWKLLNHVSRDHNMTLKPAHLSYKCTVCTATFGMYKQFENHVYSAHSTVAKKAMDNKKAPPGPGSSKSGDSLLKPLKINDEITIIPQPASRHSQKNMDIESHVID